MTATITAIVENAIHNSPPAQRAIRSRRFTERLGFDPDTAAALARRHEFGALPEREDDE